MEATVAKKQTMMSAANTGVLASTSSLLDVHHTLSNNLGILRILCHELGNVPLTPELSVLEADIADRWSFVGEEREALHQILLLAYKHSPVGAGRGLVEFQALTKVLRRPLGVGSVNAALHADIFPIVPSADATAAKFSISGKNPASHMTTLPTDSSDMTPYHQRSPVTIGMKAAALPQSRNAQRELISRLRRVSTSTVTITEAPFLRVMKEIGMDIYMASECFRKAAMSSGGNSPRRTVIHANTTVSIDQLAAILLPLLPMQRQRFFNSEFVKNSLTWKSDAELFEQYYGGEKFNNTNNDDGRPQSARNMASCSGFGKTTKSTELRTAARLAREELAKEKTAQERVCSIWSPRRIEILKEQQQKSGTGTPAAAHEKMGMPSPRRPHLATEEQGVEEKKKTTAAAGAKKPFVIPRPPTAGIKFRDDVIGQEKGESMTPQNSSRHHHHHHHHHHRHHSVEKKQDQY